MMSNPLYVVWDPDPVFFTIPQLVHADIPFGLLVKLLAGIVVLRLIYNLIQNRFYFFAKICTRSIFS